ncbi:MAG TPA: T9SS type A sorting domain-containing protein [Bacteroidia bacterium]|nr:T9SS type A sorting domain-containing protein [Bacteroidia bacterium]
MKINFTICAALLLKSAVLLSQVPVPLHPGISISHIMNVHRQVTRLAYNPIDQCFYYSTYTDSIFKIIIPSGGQQPYDVLVYTISDHGIQSVQGLAFHDSTIYVSGNNERNTPLTIGIIQRGILLSGTLREWENVAQTVPYQTASDFNHLFSGLGLNPAGDTLLMCNGSRGDHGEIQTRGGLYPGLRNVPVTSLILKIPASSVNLVIPNDSAALNASGLVFVTGIRNTYDFAYNAMGDLFGVENSSDRDDEEEINWLRQGKNYGFPWMMGGNYNPQQFAWFNPAADKLINQQSYAWSLNTYYNDPTFPQKPPGLQLTMPCKNLGPDAAFIRDSASGFTYNAAAVSKPIYSFTPHRSPLGITIDKDSILGTDFRGKCFVLSYTRGDATLNDSSVLMVPFNDTGEDLLMLEMEKDSANANYSFHSYKIAKGFNHPVDAVLLNTSMYVIECDFGGNPSLWKIDFPACATSSTINQSACGSYTLNGQNYTSSGTYTQTLVNSNGCDSVITLNLTIKTLPTASITASGPTIFCSGSNVVLNAPVAANRSYQWKKGGINIAGATLSSYTVSLGGNYKVLVTNTVTGCSKTTANNTVVTVNPLPDASINAGGPITFCDGGSVMLNAASFPNRTYQWTKGGTNISGAIASSYNVTIGGNYKVIVTNTNTACSNITTPATLVTVNTLPSATITPNGPTTFCAGGSVLLSANTGTGLTYKWKKGSNYINGATLNNYTASIAGNYRVEVTKSNACSKTSSATSVTIPCRNGQGENIISAMDVLIYPNPSTGEFTIQFSEKPVVPVTIELTDVLGQLIERFEAADKSTVVNKSNLSKGIYYIIIKNNEEVVVKRISILKS